MTRHTEPTTAQYKCKGKHPYESARIAFKRADQVGERFNVQLYVYRCPLCKHHHLTRSAYGRDVINRAASRG